MLPYVSHAEVDRAKGMARVHPAPIQTGQVRKLLTVLRTHLVHAKTREKDKTESDTQQPVCRFVDELEEELLPLYLEDLVNGFKIQQGDLMTEDTMKQFVENFQQTAKSHPQGWVGSRGLSAIITDLELDTSAQQLVREGWVEGIKAENKQKIGWYKPGQRMIDYIDRSATPANAYERALVLLAGRSGLEEQRQQLESELKEIRAQLAKLDEVAEVIQRLSNLTS